MSSKVIPFYNRTDKYGIPKSLNVGTLRKTVTNLT